jgi:hypothetical protein
MKALRRVLKSGRDFKGSASAGSNNGGVSKQRYLTLSGMVKGELASTQSS